MPNSAAYSVGIDLGTTNSAIAYAHLTAEEPSPIEVMPIPQLVNPGEVAAMPLLPSFLYVAGEFDFAAGSLTLPWHDDGAPAWVVGELARRRGAENPSRLVASAKSWLSYAGANRTSAPSCRSARPTKSQKLSPVTVVRAVPAAPAARMGRAVCGGDGDRAARRSRMCCSRFRRRSTRRRAS